MRLSSRKEVGIDQMNLHIVTGGSRGLGQALIEKVLKNGDHVAEISRGGSLNLDHAKSFKCDFATDTNKEKLIQSVFAQFNPAKYEMISLVNNAGRVEPVGYLHQLEETEIVKSIMINLVAPMALTGAFLKHLQGFKGIKLIVNVSSGVARHPKDTWAPYCAGKAGLESLSAITAQEFEGQNVKVINYEPGIIDTEMQAVIRSIPGERFPDLQRFLDFKKTGALVKPEQVAEHLYKAMFSRNLKAKNFISIQDSL